jgi:hypothetical protein
MQKQYTVCAVCRILDGDTTRKLCQFCSTCGAWICDADLGNLTRRAKAALVGAFE